MINVDGDPQDVTCELMPTGALATIRLGVLADAAGKGIMVLHHAATFPASTELIAHCSGFHVHAVGRAVLTALKVDSLEVDNH
jgi:hypothetical protein